MANEPGRNELGSAGTTGSSIDTTGAASVRGSSSVGSAGC
jgi:hypothetical protein